MWLESDLHALFSSIQHGTFDQLPMLVVCDWLQDHGEETLANAIRTLIQFSTSSDKDPKEIYRAIKVAKKELKDIERSSKAHLQISGGQTNTPAVYFDGYLYRWNISNNNFSVQDVDSGQMPRKLKSGETIPDEVIKIFLAWRANFWIDHGQFVQDPSGLNHTYDDIPIQNKQILGMLGNLFVRYQDAIDEFIDGLRPFNNPIRNFLKEVSELTNQLDTKVYHPELQDALQQIQAFVPQNWQETIDKALTKIGGM